MLKISDQGLYLIKFRECDKDAKGHIICPLVSYAATKEEAKLNKYTIGYGNTYYLNRKPVKKGDKITQEDADKLFAGTIAEFEKFIHNMIDVPLNQDQYDAIVSFVFNIGRTNFANSTFLRLLNLGNYNAAATEFLRWKYQKGVFMQGLLDRRLDEQKQFYGKV